MGQAAMLSQKNDNGGLDFVDTQQTIEFQKNPISAPVRKAIGPGIQPTAIPPPAQLLQNFKGFDFKIIGLQSMEDSMEFSSL